MTRPYEPPGEFIADNGAILRYYRRDDGGVQVSILNERHELLAGWALTPDQVIALFHELEFCEECGQPIGDADEAKHGIGICLAAPWSESGMAALRGEEPEA